MKHTKASGNATRRFSGYDVCCLQDCIKSTDSTWECLMGKHQGLACIYAYDQQQSDCSILCNQAIASSSLVAQVEARVPNGRCWKEDLHAWSQDGIWRVSMGQIHLGQDNLEGQLSMPKRANVNYDMSALVAATQGSTASCGEAARSTLPHTYAYVHTQSKDQPCHFASHAL